MAGLKAAFGLKEITEGAAFDRELQERKKLERQAAREKAEMERREADKVGFANHALAS